MIVRYTNLYIYEIVYIATSFNYKPAKIQI